MSSQELRSAKMSGGEMQKVPFFSAAGLTAGIDVKSSIERVVRSNRYVLAAEVERFEARFAEYCASRHCVSVANGTDALEIALRVLGVQSGQSVGLVANAGFYGSTAVRAMGAIPRYCDVDSRTRNIDLNQLEALVRSRKPPAALIVTHLYGRLAPMTEIMSMTRAANVPVIEDCAQAHGAWASGKRAGTFGDIGCFSFYPTKNLGALGDGGALTTDSQTLALRVRSTRQYGWEDKYKVTMAGGRNSRLDELQAAILCDKLPSLDVRNARRVKIAEKYRVLLASTPVLAHSNPSVQTECQSDHSSDVAHLFVIETARRDALRRHLAKWMIGSEIHYPIPDHLQPAFRCEQEAGDLPVTEKLCKQVLSLPCHPDLRDAEVDYVSEAVKSFFLDGGT